MFATQVWVNKEVWIPNVALKVNASSQTEVSVQHASTQTEARAAHVLQLGGVSKGTALMRRLQRLALDFSALYHSCGASPLNAFYKCAPEGIVVA